MSANILDRRGFAMVAGRVLGAGFAVAGLGPRAALAAEESPAPRIAGDIFTAERVPVDVTAVSVNDARDRGLVQGRVTGLRKVIERLVARDDLSRVPTLTSTQIIDMVRDFSIANERSSAVRYIADLTVRFDPNAVRKLLRNAGIPFAETMSKPLVVVPVLRTENRTLLWEENNPWRAAWIKTASANGLVPLLAPNAEPKDISAVSLDQALNKDPGALATLASAYDAGGALVAVAVVDGPAVRVTLTAVRPGVGNDDLTAGAAAQSGQSFEDLLAAAARAASSAVEENWRTRNSVTFGTVGQLTALVPITALKDWLTVRERLTGVSLIERVDLQAITRDRAQVTLYYAGQREQLRLAMSQRDLSLTQQSGVWVIGAGRATP
ncbi:MAG: DUF2066 domain-containing protein [Rhodospirillaceae bacterium]